MPDNVKPSRMLLRLEAEIAAAPTALEADCKRAERAAYLSRLGRIPEARAELDELRRQYSRTPIVEVSAWINLAEGLVAYFSNVGVSTTDHVQRAYALSAAAGLQPLRAVCAAWLAQWDYSKLNMDSLVQHLREALQIAEPKNHAAISRAALVAAQALHLAGRLDLAQPWYRRSREHAAADSDDVTISALMHNMAWLHMLEMRQIVLSGSGDDAVGQRALANAESTARFDEMKGDSSWQELKPILRAQILSLQGHASEALALYKAHLANVTTSGRLQANLLADKSWCHANLGEMEDAQYCADQSIAGFVDGTQIDDRAAAHSRLAQAFALLKDAPKCRNHQLLATQDWGLYVVPCGT